MIFSCCRANDAVVDDTTGTTDHSLGRPPSTRKALHHQFGNSIVIDVPQKKLESYLSPSASSLSSGGCPLGLGIEVQEFRDYASHPHSRSIAHREDDGTKLNHVSTEEPSTHSLPNGLGNNTPSYNRTSESATYPVIRDISSQSPFLTTSLEVGMVILEIQEASTQNLSMERVKDLFLQAMSQKRSSLSLRAAFPVVSSTAADDSISKRGRRRLASAASLILNRHLPQDRITEGHGDALASRSIVAVAHKEHFEQDLGLTLKRTQAGTFLVQCIETISPFYPRETSLLREGMYLTSINGLQITGRDMEVALSALRDAAPGYLVVTAELPREMKEPPMLRKRVEASIQKSPGQAAGLSLLRLPLGGGATSDLIGNGTSKHLHKKKDAQTFITVVGKIYSDSPFARTDLKVGMEIVSVNGMNVAKSDARSILRFIQEECTGGITIHAEMDVPAEETVTTEQTASASLDRSSNFSQGGASASQSSGIHSQRTQPRALSERSNQAQAPSNNAEHSSNSAGEAPALPYNYPSMIQGQDHLRTIKAPGNSAVPSSHQRPPVAPSTSVMGSVESSAQTYRSTYSASSNSSPYPGIMRVYAWKHSHNQRLGVLLSEDSGSFFVSRISADSIFAGTDLVLGAEVMSLNGVQLFGTDLVFVATLMQSIVGDVVLEYLPPSSASVALSSRSSSSSLQERVSGHN